MSSSCLFAVLLPGPVAVQPFAYITNQGSNDVSVIDTEDNRVAAIIPVGQTAGVR